MSTSSSSLTDAPSTWRFATSGGIAYRFLGLKGQFDSEDAGVTWSVLIQSRNLIAFMAELFPAPINFGGIHYNPAFLLPGSAGLVAKRAHINAHTDGKPIDPLSADLSATAGTYGDYIQVDVEFGTVSPTEGNPNPPDPSDPTTFLEITASESSEILYVPPGDTKIVDEENPGGVQADGEINEENLEQEEPRANTNPNLPTTIVIPTTEWNLKWKRVPYSNFRNTIVKRLRFLSGKVNDDVVPFLHSAAHETVLYAGHSYTEEYSWRDGNVLTPPVTVNIKLVEKRIEWKEYVVGWNHVWEPGKGWKRVQLADGTDPYKQGDLGFVFQV